MKKILFTTLIVLIVFLLLPVWAGAADYYVTETGDGAPMSMAEFNALTGTGYAGDTFYFSGTITTRLELGISGTSGGGNVTLDGYQAGTYNATNGLRTNLSSLAEIKRPSSSIELYSVGYITIQDFYFNGNNGSGSSAIEMVNANHITIRRSYFFEYEQNAIFSSNVSSTSSYITIGGASGDGIEVYCVGNFTGAYDIKLGNAHDVIISYNKLWGSSESEFGTKGISWGNGRENNYNYLIEHNYVANHLGDRPESGIGGKGGTNFIIRYNYISGHYGNEYHGNEYGIGPGYDAQYFYVYGNYITNNSIGIYITNGTDWGDNGIDQEYIYIWSNIIEKIHPMDDVAWAGILVGDTSGDITDHVYIRNNTIYANPAPGLPDYGYPTSGIRTRSNADNIYINNNIFSENRPDESDYIQAYIYDSSDVEQYKDNLHYHSGGAAKVVWGGSGSTAPGDIDATNDVGNPNFVNPTGGNFTLAGDSPAIDGGADLSGLVGSVTVQGTTYNMYWDDCLDPVNTNWSTIPPTVVSVKQDDYGTGWEQGAYVYTSGDAAAQRVIIIN